MKKQLLLAGLALISTVAFAQKKEIKKAEKALKAKNSTEALSYVSQAEALIGGAKDEMKVQFYLIKGEANLADAGSDNFAKMKAASEAFKAAEALNPKGDLVARLGTGKTNLRTALFNSAVNDQKKKDYATAADKLYLSYMASKADTSDLYYAAGSAYTAKKYDMAVDYYEQLLNMGYTGISTTYSAVNKETGKKDYYATANERDLMVKFGTHDRPGIEQATSKTGDILKSLSLAYSETGATDKAKEAFTKARAKDPKNTALIINEANLYYKLGDNEKFKSLMEEALSLIHI